MRTLVQTLSLLLLMLVINAALADIAVVSARDGGIETLSEDEAQLLYLGRLTALRDGTQVRLLDLPPGDVRDQFYRLLTGRNPVQIRAYWSRMVFTGRGRPPRQMESSTEMVETLRREPNSIGYLPAHTVPPDLRILMFLP